MDQAGQQIFEFLSHYGYAIMLPLMIIEGPIVTIIAAMLASLGAFNVFIVLILSVIGDMGGDIILYGLGYKFGMGFVRRVGKYIGITENLVLRMENYFLHHGGKTIFAVKATTGLCWATFTAAGIVKMNFRKFVKYSFLGGVVWSGFLVAMGYFYGYLWREIQVYIKWIGWAIFGIAIVSFVIINIYKGYQAKKLLKENGNGVK
ncbi:MAG TPA: DedA family protein [Candidatus Moranbacteria bacterium]|nr:DedA family protein [Candidatus Moranbacteria bacterium]